MRKQLILASAVIFAGSTLFLTSCNKEDTTPPVITINGSASVTSSLNANYTDAGATAKDDEDGDVAVVVDNTVNKDIANGYTITYTATDAAGNSSVATRSVVVANDLTSSPFTGSYACVITSTGAPYSYNDGNTISATLNNVLSWNKFGDYSNATAKLNMTISGTNVTVPAQSITCGTPAVLRQFSGSGTITGTGSAGSVVTLQITETVNSISGNFVYTFTKL